MAAGGGVQDGAAAAAGGAAGGPAGRGHLSAVTPPAGPPLSDFDNKAPADVVGPAV